MTLLDEADSVVDDGGDLGSEDDEYRSKHSDDEDDEYEEKAQDPWDNEDAQEGGGGSAEGSAADGAAPVPMSTDESAPAQEGDVAMPPVMAPPPIMEPPPDAMTALLAPMMAPPPEDTAPAAMEPPPDAMTALLAPMM